MWGCFCRDKSGVGDESEWKDVKKHCNGKMMWVILLHHGPVSTHDVAIFMDQGAASAHQFALGMILSLLDETDPKIFLSFVAFPKNTLKNLLRSEGNVAAALPTYEILAETGRKTHNPTFLVEVFSEDRKLAAF